MNATPPSPLQVWQDKRPSYLSVQEWRKLATGQTLSIMAPNPMRVGFGETPSPDEVYGWRFEFRLCRHNDEWWIDGVGPAERQFVPVEGPLTLPSYIADTPAYDWLRFGDR